MNIHKLVNRRCAGNLLQLAFHSVSRRQSSCCQLSHSLSLSRSLIPQQKLSCWHTYSQEKHSVSYRSSYPMASFSTSSSQPEKKEKSSDEMQPPSEPQKLSLLQRFKQMYKEYWYVLLPVHAGTSIMWFGGFYYVAKSGIDIVPILEWMSMSETIIKPFRDSSAGYLAISYALYKVATPARYAVTIGGTTLSINYLKHWGYIKPVPSRERLKEMYEEKKDQLRGRFEEQKDHFKEQFQDTKASQKSKTSGQ